jgi:hypothetical protein
MKVAYLRSKTGVLTNLKIPYIADIDAPDKFNCEDRALNGTLTKGVALGFWLSGSPF